MALTEIEQERAANYLVRTMVANNVNVQDPVEIIKWVVSNPLPSKAVWEAAELSDEDEAKQRHIAALRTELTKLEGR